MNAHSLTALAASAGISEAELRGQLTAMNIAPNGHGAIEQAMIRAAVEKIVRQRAGAKHD